MTDIRPATADDLPRIEQIYDAIHTAEETGAASVGWARGVYPTRATAQAALDDGALFVLEDDGVLVAAGRIDQVQVPVYAQVPWQYAAPPEQVLVLHTLVVDPTIAGAATARSSCAFMPGAPARSAARCCASTRMQKTPLPAGSTPVSASARPPSCRAPSTASQA